MTPFVRPAYPTDLNYVMDIDLKSYEYPWTQDDWQTINDDKTYHKFVATLSTRPIGFAIWTKEENEAVIIRLAVKRSHQRQGAGSRLLEALETDALTNSCSIISIIVPEFNCCPKSADDVSQWLLNRGFKTMLPIIPQYALMYGQFVDGFKFIKEIKKHE